jgi:hypothetical protein
MTAHVTTHLPARLPDATERTHVGRSAAMLGFSIVVVLGLLVGLAVAASQLVQLAEWFATP